MPRLFLPEDDLSNQSDENFKELVITGDDAFHLAAVLRMRSGDEVTLCSSGGKEYAAVISDIVAQKKNYSVRLAVRSVSLSQNEPKTHIRVFQGMPKGKKTDSIIQKCIELGAGEIVFVFSDRAVPRNAAESENKLPRLQKIADEAAKQCGRGKRIAVSFLESFDSALEIMCRNGECFVCYENEQEGSIKEQICRNTNEISFFVGPEGGLSEREIALCRQRAVPTVTLGKLILRTETASPAVLAMIRYEKEL